jgi:NAD(P)-dependent dehydrogenase (short-subunit alcohol dehydrogenase family)
MAEQRSGAIVNTSSFAFRGDYGGTGYPAGKGAVNGFTLAVHAAPGLLGYRDHKDSPPWSLTELHQMVTQERSHRC